MEEKNHYIYMHDNKVNHKKYIGQCKGRPERRWRQDGSGYIGRCPKFSDAINKWGWNNFDHIILKENLTLEEANYWEEYYIDYYHTWIEDPLCWGYNLQKGGNNRTQSQETKNKLSIINSGNGNPHYGTHRSEETKRKLMLANGQKIRCIETNIIYNSMMEAERMTGIPNTNISKACRGLRHTAGGYHWEKIIDEEI